jgi:hypothetical protein
MYKVLSPGAQRAVQESPNLCVFQKGSDVFDRVYINGRDIIELFGSPTIPGFVFSSILKRGC